MNLRAIGIFISFGFLLGFFCTNPTLALYDSSCSEYGVMAYESGGYCKCMSGYVMGESILGDTQCVSGNSVCTDEYGYGAEYDSLSSSCECRYGYVWGEDMLGNTECISDDQACRNELGFNARATYGGQCECSYGYVIDGGKCKDGDSVCRLDHGIYSSYDDLSNKCECDDGYTFNDDYQCVEKQNNVYFKVLDLNLPQREVLVKSEYDFSKYIIRYGIGCWDSLFERYEGKDIVINLGTDFYIDTYDTIVLQDHDQTCSITSTFRTYDDSFPEPEEPNDYTSFNFDSFVSTQEKYNGATEDSIEQLSQDSTLVQVEPLSEEIHISSTTPSEGLIINYEREDTLVNKILTFFRSLFR